jgi:ATP-dependent DNA helicase DinG
MFCEKCQTLFPYRKDTRCLICGSATRLTADDLLGPSDARIVSEIRPPQVEFAKAIEKSIGSRRHMTAEAGTGTGKSFAAILPPLLAGKRVVVSTATVKLQSQYVQKDLPFLQTALAEHGYDFEFALAKGKSHYLCPARLEGYAKSNTVPKAFAAWAKDTRTGDKEELEKIPKFWWKISADECIGSRYCPVARKHKCPYIDEKSKAARANIIVANHALVGFNLRFGGNLLPQHDVLLLDEAHKAKEYISNAFAQSLSEKTIPSILDRVEQADLLSYEALRQGKWNVLGLETAVKAAEDMEKHNKDLFAAFPKQSRDAQCKFDIAKVEGPANDIELAVDNLLCYLYTLCESHPTGATHGDKKIFFLDAERDRAHPGAIKSVQDLSRLADNIHALHTEEENERCVRYIEFPRTSKQSRKLCRKPIDIAPEMQLLLFPTHQVIASSATITIGDSFKHFHAELGFDPDYTDQYMAVSPFDYDRRALLYLTKNVPHHPSRNKNLGEAESEEALQDYYDKMAEEICDLVHMSAGHAFVLFTNRTEMGAVAERVEKEVDYPVIVQSDETTPAEAERQFRSKDNPILFGLKSFWEGVSIEGDQLRLVIIAKVPFPQKSDLVYQELRAEAEKALGSGYRAFMQLDVPNMIMDVKQAAGRLLRNMDDYGVVALLDRKITEEWKSRKSTYAKMLVRDLPFTQVTSSHDFTNRFLRQFKMKDEA